MGLGTGALVAGLFGMNVRSTLPDPVLPLTLDESVDQSFRRAPLCILHDDGGVGWHRVVGCMGRATQVL
jgi:hypothetical protein